MRDALSGISLKSKIALGIAGAIMFIFFAVQTCVVFGLCSPNYELARFGYGCVIGFMPPFFVFVSEFLLQKRSQTELIGTIVKVALIVIISVGIITTCMYGIALFTGMDTQIIGSTWSNMLGILLTNAFSIVGTIMGVKYASEKQDK